MTPVSIRELEQAINEARRSSPASGAESSLSGDISIMASVYGQLIFRGHSVFDADSLMEPEQHALHRWLAVVRLGDGKAGRQP